MNCAPAKGMILPKAYKRVREPNVFGPMMVKMGDADAYVAGLTYEYPEVIKPALQIHRTRPGVRLVTGVYIMIVETGSSCSRMPRSYRTHTPGRPG